ncbi:unnamed protein product, partial [Iphiclides podalirius]
MPLPYYRDCLSSPFSGSNSPLFQICDFRLIIDGLDNLGEEQTDKGGADADAGPHPGKILNSGLSDLPPLRFRRRGRDRCL